MSKSFKISHSVGTGLNTLVSMPCKASICIPKCGFDSHDEKREINQLSNDLLANKPVRFLKFAKDSLVEVLSHDFLRNSSLCAICLPMLMKPDSIHPRLFQGNSLKYVTCEPESTFFATNEDGMLVGNSTIYFCNRDVSLLKIPDDMSTIFASAFFGCNYLNTISIPKSVAKIYPEAFRCCHYLETVSFASGSKMKKLNCDVFMCCHNLTKIQWDEPSSLKEIGKGALKGLHSLECVVLPSSLETISEEAFMNCTNLKQINLQDCKMLKEIKDSAFKETSVGSIKFSSSLEDIGPHAFSGCQNLYQIIFPEDSNLIFIQVFAFSGCISLKKISFSKSLRRIGERAFTNLNIEEIKFPKDSRLEIIDDNAFRFNKLKSVDFPESLIRIGSKSFMCCTGLTKITFPINSRLQVIGNLAFYNASIRDLYIPANVKAIGSMAFLGNYMKSITIENNSHLKEVEKDSFCMNEVKEDNFIAPKEVYNMFKQIFITNRSFDEAHFFDVIVKIRNDVTPLQCMIYKSYLETLRSGSGNKMSSMIYDIYKDIKMETTDEYPYI